MPMLTIEGPGADGVVTATLDRPPANALTREFFVELEALLARLAGDATRALVSPGTGRFFSAGLDLFQVFAADAAGFADFTRHFDAGFAALFAFPKPVVAAVNGHAVAGGAVLAACADFHLVADGGGRIGLTEIQVGVPFPASILEIVRHACDGPALREVVYHGRTYLPAEACQRRLADEVVPAAELPSRARALAASATREPVAFAEIKRALRAEVLARIGDPRAGDGPDLDHLAIGRDARRRRRLSGPDARREGVPPVSAGETLAHRLAGGECGALRDGRLAPDVAARATDLFLDYLGVTLAGAVEESTIVLRRGLGALGAGGDATVIGADERLAPPAALANGAAAHAIEMDDTHLGGSIHLGASVFSAALAAAELVPASGITLLRAAVAGYEVAARLAVAADPAAQYRRGFHPTGTCGAFGAAAAAGVVFGLDADGVTAALGVAGSQAAGSMEFLEDGAWTKRFHPGWAASAGLHAAALARAGFRAPQTIVDGRFGFLHAYGDGAAAMPARDDDFELMRTGIKPHACCRYSQGPIDAVLALRARHAIDPMRVARIDVGIVARRLPDRLRAARREAPAALGRRRAVQPAVQRRDGARPRRRVARGLPADPLRRARESATSWTACAPRATRRSTRASRARGRAGCASTLDDGAVLEERVDHPLGDPENFPIRGRSRGEVRAARGTRAHRRPRT